MAAINFPDSPSVNDTYTVGDKTWRWDGNYWRILALPSDIDTLIKDADNDTKVQVEESADEDIIRFDVAGVEKMSLDALGLDVVDDLDVHGNITVDGQTNVGGHILPDTDVTYDLGSATYRFRDIYLSGSSINLGGVAITSDGTNLTLPPISNISGDFTVDTNTLHVDSTNNRVGVGTTTPTVHLDVNGGASIGQLLTVGQGLTVDTDTLHVDGANNRVGIGTTSPGYLLELEATTPILNVKGADTSYAEIRAVGTSQGTGAVYVGQSSTYGGGILYNGDGSPSYAVGETADHVSFFRRNNGTNEVVFSYSYSNNNVTFRGTAQFASASVTSATASSSLLRNITLSTSAPTGGNDGDVWMVYS